MIAWLQGRWEILLFVIGRRDSASAPTFRTALHVYGWFGRRS